MYAQNTKIVKTAAILNTVPLYFSLSQVQNDFKQIHNYPESAKERRSVYIQAAAHRFYATKNDYL